MEVTETEEVVGKAPPAWRSWELPEGLLPRSRHTLTAVGGMVSGGGGAGVGVKGGVWVVVDYVWGLWGGGADTQRGAVADGGSGEGSGSSGGDWETTTSAHLSQCMCTD